MEYISKNVGDTAKIAADFLAGLKKNEGGATVVGLYGELGSGKTTFMKYLAEKLGVKEPIQSPTFVIMKNYSLNGASKKAQGEELSNLRLANFQTLIHIDAYRIEREEEMAVLGWKEIIGDPKNLVCIEWPEKVKNILPEHIKIVFSHIDENVRSVVFES